MTALTGKNDNQCNEDSRDLHPETGPCKVEAIVPRGTQRSDKLHVFQPEKVGMAFISEQTDQLVADGDEGFAEIINRCGVYDLQLETGNTFQP